MAKIGYIMAISQYDKLEEDREWMNNFGCIRIVEECDENERNRPLWKQLMVALQRGDELGYPQIFKCHPWQPGTGYFPGILPGKSYSRHKHTRPD